MAPRVLVPDLSKDYPELDRSGWMRSAHHAILERLMQNGGDLHGIQPRELVPHLRNFENQGCQDDLECAMVLDLAQRTLDVWRRVNEG